MTKYPTNYTYYSQEERECLAENWRQTVMLIRAAIAEYDRPLAIVANAPAQAAAA